MGSVNQSQNKASTSTQNTGLPNWAQVGSDAYKNMNSFLQTAPMGVASQTFTQGGIGQTGQNAINTLQGGGAAQDYLTGTARGDYLNGSPYLDDIISKNAQDIGTQTNQLFAAGGRYGSAAHQGTLADSIGNMSNQLRNQNYQFERGNQLNAANALESSQVNRALGAAGLENQGFQNMLGMISQLPTIQGNKVFDANQQMGIGGQIDQRTQQGLNDLINQWTQLDNEDWARLGGLISAAQGVAGPYGTQTQTSKQPMNLFGALAGLLAAPSSSVFGGFFK